MKGEVDEAGRALLSLQVRSGGDTAPRTLTAWVDTAFDGELVASQSVIDEIGLQKSAAVQATLADGTSVLLETFHCQIDWFGEWREVEVIANEGHMPLLGLGLLRGRKLTIDYGNGEMELA